MPQTKLSEAQRHAGLLLLIPVLSAYLTACSRVPGIVEPDPVLPTHVQVDGDLTPPALYGVTGFLIARSTPVAGWPSHFDQNLDAAIDRMVAEVGAGSYCSIPDCADGDNPHYGPLRMVTMRNIRAGLPLDPSEPGFAAALRITREAIETYFKPTGTYRVSQAQRYSMEADAEIVWWLTQRGELGDTQLASRCQRLHSLGGELAVDLSHNQDREPRSSVDG